MSFKLFIYYCALCGGWAAFMTWAVVQAVGLRPSNDGPTMVLLKVVAIGGLLGAFLAGAVGMVDAVLNATGSQRFVRTLLCMAIGFFGGMLGSFIGQMLVFISPYLLFIGWMIVGVFIGASIGAYDVFRALTTKQEMKSPVKKVLNGVYGGFLGGLIGGAPFGIINGLSALPRSDLLIGLVLLGLFIGLMIGLAQVFLKEAWLKVEAGFRAGREVMLSKDETTIGRGEACDIGLFGASDVEKLHARILLKNNRYLLADADTPGGTYLNDQRVAKATPLRSGDAIRVGNCVLRFGERQKR